MRRWSGGALGLGLGLALGLVVGEGAAAAGDRRVEILVVDMGIAGDPAAKSCVRDFVGRLGEEYTTVGRLGRAALVRRVGEVPAGGRAPAAGSTRTRSRRLETPVPPV